MWDPIVSVPDHFLSFNLTCGFLMLDRTNFLCRVVTLKVFPYFGKVQRTFMLMAGRLPKGEI